MAVTEGLQYMALDGRLGSAAMEASSNAGVTPDGVRAGDPAALQALVDRRGPAVVAFCTQVCGPQMADRAAAEAFARFRAAVRDAPDLNILDPEALLRGATRHAAASMARQPSGPPPHGKLRSRGTQTCEHVPTMLAARANGALGKADLERLARHLDRCERCDASAEIFRRAELAYQDPAVDTLGTETSSVLIAALLAVSEHGHGVAPAPALGAPAVESLDGAFGHLPDLDDEVPIVVAPPEPAPIETLDEVAEAGDQAGEPAPIEAPNEVAEAGDPGGEPVAAELAAEPMPEAAPADLQPGGEAYEDFYADDEIDFGETMEWDNELPEVAHLRDPSDPFPDAPALTGGKARRSGGLRPLMILLPVLLVAAIAAGAAALAGVFNGDDGAATVSKPPAARVQAPVITPLPIKIQHKPTTAATTGAATGAATSASTGTASTGAATTGATGTAGSTTTP
ncbi:MAG TPA: hypothetical protein VNT55_17110 [Baekduia sp.]|nr:hypothetical protein [Baekduia sp.]